MSRQSPPILISLSSFGRELALDLGQAALAEIVAQAGADGVEYRGELQRSEPGEIAAQRGVAQAHGLVTVWSSPEGIWDAAGELDRGALERAFATAAELGAYRVKMSLGGYRCGCDLEPLRPWATRTDIELVVENDQTEQAGTQAPLQDFFRRARALGWPVPMTFDMGNWHWTGEDPLACADDFAAVVGYVHAKGVLRRPRDWVAVPLPESQAAWRAVLRRLPAHAPRAVEYPLQGEDLVTVTRQAVDGLRKL
ncbi:MAG: hypothetical protein RJA36_1828 [Pseudomonadota bacterium]|jgi:sugar phosphate isomerase/epimerase